MYIQVHSHFNTGYIFILLHHSRWIHDATYPSRPMNPRAGTYGPHWSIVPCPMIYHP